MKSFLFFMGIFIITEITAFTSALFMQDQLRDMVISLGKESMNLFQDTTIREYWFNLQVI